MSLTGVFVYPIKSCKGISCERSRLTSTGLQYDREWMLIDVKTRRFVSQRSVPKLSRVHVDVYPSHALFESTSSEDALLRVSTPEMSNTLQVPLGKRAKEEEVLVEAKVWSWSGNAHDEGDDAAKWFSTFLGVDVRLVRFCSHRQTEPEFAPDSETAFSDGYPYLMTTQGKLTFRM